MSEAAHTDPLIGTTIAERYRIEAPLGEGGIGRVYRARHETLGRAVALKVLLAQYESIPVLKQRFEREAKALAALSHPNIVTVTDFGVEGDMPYLVMELLEGVDLSGLVHGPPLEPQRALEIVRQALRALDYAHAQGLVHRDLKPHNVFVREMGDGTDHVEVLDFGLARFVGDAAKHSPKLTQQGALLGTPAYMAPEQASGMEADARADVYAMGCVLFEALTGRRVFESNDPGQVLKAHLLSPPPRMSQADPGLAVDASLERLVARALAKSAPERFQSAKEMLDALDALPPDAVRRVGPRPARSAPVSGVAPTQAPAISAPTAAGTPKALEQRQQQAASEGSIHLPQSRLPLMAGLGCGVVLIMGLLGGGIMWASEAFSSEEQGDTPPAPVPGVQPSPVAPPTPSAPARPAARDPFAGAVPEELAGLKRRAEAVRRGSRPARQLLSDISRYQSAHPDDPRPHLVLAHLYVRARWLSRALPEYQTALALDESVRGYAELLPDLLEMVRSNSLETEAGDMVRDVFGAAARPAVQAALEERMRPEERQHLEALLARLPAAP